MVKVAVNAFFSLKAAKFTLETFEDAFEQSFAFMLKQTIFAPAHPEMVLVARLVAFPAGGTTIDAFATRLALMT